MLSPAFRAQAGKGRPRGALNKATREIRDAARRLLEDAGYVHSLRRRLTAGKAPHMETLLHYYAYGKPADTVKLDTPPPRPIQILMQGGPADPASGG